MSNFCLDLFTRLTTKPSGESISTRSFFILQNFQVQGFLTKFVVCRVCSWRERGLSPPGCRTALRRFPPLARLRTRPGSRQDRLHQLLLLLTTAATKAAGHNSCHARQQLLLLQKNSSNNYSSLHQQQLYFKNIHAFSEPSLEFCVHRLSQKKLLNNFLTCVFYDLWRRLTGKN